MRRKGVRSLFWNPLFFHPGHPPSSSLCALGTRYLPLKTNQIRRGVRAKIHFFKNSYPLFPNHLALACAIGTCAASRSVAKILACRWRDPSFFFTLFSPYASGVPLYVSSLPPTAAPRNPPDAQEGRSKQIFNHSCSYLPAKI